jgi:NADPH-dependent glutamate synthase beta subunit-like oxidoreductase
VPACAYPAREGLEVDSASPEVHAARRTALELLIGEHLGDCVGPCVSICPAHLDIPRMLAQLQAGQLREALITAKQTIPLPAVLGYICPAP